MAKMFYTLEEAAQKLGVDSAKIKQMANNGQIQQYKDRDKLMFKRDQIDAISAAGGGGKSSDDTGEISLSDPGASGSGAIPLADPGMSGTGEIPLADSGDTGVLAASGAEGTGEFPLADSGDTDALGTSGVVKLDAGDSALEGSGMGGNVLGASGIRGSELGGAEELVGSGLGSSGLLSGLSGGTGIGSSVAGSGLGSSGVLGTDTGGEEGTGLIDLAEDPSSARNGKSASHSSGVSVFDADEVDHADPMAQTIMTESPGGGSGGEEMALDSIGSGSGLLDLTREADDTSLGAELLDEIYPGAGDTGSSTKMDTATAASSGVFDGSVTVEAKDASGMELPEATEAATAEAEAEPAPAPMVTVQYVGDGPFDPTGSGMSAGFLMVATVALIAGLLVAFGSIAGVPSALVSAMTANQNALWMYMGIGFAAAVIFGIGGFFVGKILNR